MSMIDRYRKRGGFLQLLTLIETTANPKQEKFLGMIAEEDGHWEKLLREKMLTPQKLASLDQNAFMDLAARVPPLNLGVFLSGLSEGERARLSLLFGHREKRQIDEALENHKISPGEAHTCFVRIASEFREMIKEGKIKLEKVKPEWVIDENVEENLLGRPSVEKLLADLEGVVTPERANESISEEISYLKRKMAQLQADLYKTQQENAVLKAKLDQIRKIA